MVSMAVFQTVGMGSSPIFRSIFFRIYFSMPKRSFQTLHELIVYHLGILGDSEEDFRISISMSEGDYEKIQNNQIGVELGDSLLNTMATNLSLDKESKAVMVFLSKRLVDF